MFAYWFLFVFFAAGVLVSSERRVPVAQPRLVLAGGALIIALLIGLRYEVGADWFNYKQMFSVAGRIDLDQALARGDPGYQLLNWIVQHAGGELWVVNLFCGAVFSWGLFRFCKVQSNPWLAIMVAVPYLVIVVAMGYSRQAVAIGFLMAGLAAIARGASVVRFALFIFAAALFHKSVVVGLLLVAFASQRNKFLNALVLIAACILFYDLFLSDSIDMLLKNYIEREYSSQGAAVRIAMSIIPAAIFLIAPKRFKFSEREQQIWRNFSIAALALLVLLFVLPSSTVVDRLALYIIPLQLAILSRVPGAFIGRTVGKILIVAYCFAVQFAWLNYASHAEYWLPYRFFPFG